MTQDDLRMVKNLIQKLKGAATSEERERASADLTTAVMMAAEPELMFEPPVIIRQNNRTYRAYPIPA
jgi:hypothetical protein